MKLVHSIKKLFCPSHFTKENEKLSLSAFSPAHKTIHELECKIRKIETDIKKLSGCEIRIAGLNQDRARHYRIQREQLQIKKELLMNQLLQTEQSLDLERMFHHA